MGFFDSALKTVGKGIAGGVQLAPTIYNKLAGGGGSSSGGGGGVPRIAGSGYQPPQGFSGPNAINPEFNAAYAAGSAYYGPDMQYLQQQQDSINRRLALNSAELAARQADLQAGYSSSMADINTRLGTIGVDRTETMRQFPMIDQMQQLADEYLKATMTGYNAQEAETRNQTAIQKFGFMSDVAARGAATAVGTSKGLSSIAESLTNAVMGIDANRTQATLSREEQQIQFDEQRAQANDRLSRLDIEAQGLGVKADALGAQLAAGMQLAGISSYITMADLMDALNSNNYQVAQLGRQIMGQAMQYASAVGSGQLSMPIYNEQQWVSGDSMLGY